MECQINTYKVTNIISCFLLIIAMGFIMTQSIINFIYSINTNKHIIAERLVYEQFSHEVYSNINSKPIKEIIQRSSSCEEGEEPMRIPIKIETFYDCENIDDESIDKYCQDKITSVSLCCSKECCFEEVSGKKVNRYCFQKIENDKEPREGLCTKFSKYNGKIYKINNTHILCSKKLDNSYENLLSRSYKYSYCNYLDSKNNCYNEESVLYNNNKIVVKNIFSYTKPNYFPNSVTSSCWILI